MRTLIILIVLTFGCVSLSPVTMAQESIDQPAAKTLTTKKKKKKRKKSRKKKDDDQEPPQVWNKWRFWWFNVGMFQGTYSDSQVDENSTTTQKLSDVKLTGQRFKAEGNLQGHGYFFTEFRNAKTDVSVWTKHTAILAGFDILLPWYPVIAPSFGVHLENNQIDTTNRDSQAVSKLSARAWYLGLHVTQRIYSPTLWSSLFVHGRYHKLNPRQEKDSGQEYELALGMAWRFGIVRFDTMIGTIRQTFQAQQAFDDTGSQELRVDSEMTLNYGQIRIWI